MTVASVQRHGPDGQVLASPARPHAPLMKGTVVLSHGLESGPHATKVSALARVAAELGWDSLRPDYRDLDATRDVANIVRRVDRIVDHMPTSGRVILAGSSMGAYTSGLASMQRRCEALFLMALPVALPRYPTPFQAIAVPTVLVHGWRDELCPVDDVIALARQRGDTLHLVDDDHRLAAHVEWCAEAFRQQLIALQ